MIRTFTLFDKEITQSRRHVSATVFLLLLFSLLGMQEVWAQCELTATISPSESICYNTGTTVTITGTLGATVNFTAGDTEGSGILSTPTGNEGEGKAEILLSNLTSTITYTLQNISKEGCDPQPLNDISSKITVRRELISSITSGPESGTASTTICYGSRTDLNFAGTPGAIVTYSKGVNGPTFDVTLDASSGLATVETEDLTGDATYLLKSIKHPDEPNCGIDINGSTEVKVRDELVASISGSTTVCYNAGTTLTISGTTGSVVRYQVGAEFVDVTLVGGSATINAANLTSDVTYTLINIKHPDDPTCIKNIDGSATGSSAKVTVRKELTATIVQPDAICSGNTAEVSITGTQNARVTYKINAGSATVITLGENGIGKATTGPLTADATFSLLSIEYPDAPVCNQLLDKSATITVNRKPADAGAIMGETTVCSGDTNKSYSIEGVADATSYQWTVPSGASITDGQGTTAITVNFATTASGTLDITVTPKNSNGCGDGASKTVSVTVNGSVTKPVFRDSPATRRCAGRVDETKNDTDQYTAFATNVDRYQWRVSPSFAGIISDVTLNADGSSTAEVSWDPNFGFGQIQDATIYVEAFDKCERKRESSHVVRSVVSPKVSLEPGRIVCDDTNGKSGFSVTAKKDNWAAQGFVWSVLSKPDAMSVVFGSTTSQTTTVSVTGSGELVLQVTATRTDIDSPVCTATAEATYTITPSPKVNAITSTTDIVCVNATLPLNNTTAGGDWSSLNPTIATVSATGVVTGKGEGTATIQYKVTKDGCSTTVTKAITVNAGPTVAAITGLEAICIGSTTTFESTTARGTWSSSNPAVATVTRQNGNNNENKGIVTGVAAGEAIISYTVKGSNECSTTVTKTIRVDPASFGGTAYASPEIICHNTGATVRLSGNTGTVVRWERSSVSNFSSNVTMVSNSANVTSITPTNLTATTYYRAVVKSGECTQVFSSTATVTVRANLATTSVSGNPNPVCYNTASTITFTGVGGTRITYKRDGGADQTIDIPATATTATVSTGSLTAATTYTLVSASYLSAPNCSTPLVNKSVEVTVRQPATGSFTGIENGATYFAGEASKTLVGSPAGGTFSGPGVSGNTFSPCTAFGSGTEAKTVIITYSGKDGNDCAYTTSKEVTIKPSTYTVLNVANPFTICRGQSTVFTAVVYRDVQLVYPYTNDPFNVSLRNNAVYNEAYTDYYRAFLALNGVPNASTWTPSNTEKLYPERTLQPIPINPDPNLSIAQQLNVSDYVLGADLFNYQWWRNGVAQGPDTDVRKIAALSATDEIRVAVKPKNAVSCINWTGPLLSGGSVVNGFPSNYLFFSEPEYSLTLPPDSAPINICRGDNSVVIAFPKGSFKWTKTNATIYWKLKRTGVALPYTLQTINIPSNATPEEVDAIFQLTAEEINAGLVALNVDPAELIHDDEVYIEYISDIDREVRNKCNQNAEINRSDIVKVTVNAILSATPNPPVTPPVICYGDSYEFTNGVTVQFTGTAPTYQWQMLKNGVVVHQESLTGTGANTWFLTQDVTANPGLYTIQVQVSNGCPNETTAWLQLGTLRIRKEVQDQTILVNGVIAEGKSVSYCGTEPARPIISLASSQLEDMIGSETDPDADPNGNIWYRLINNATNVAIGIAQEGTGDSISFGEHGAGSYRIEGFYRPNPTCFKPMGNVTIIDATPTVTLDAVPACQVTTLTATAAGGSGTYTTYTWTDANGQKTTSTSPTFDAKINGTYTVTVTDSENCTSLVASQSITVKQPQRVDLSLRVTWINDKTQWKVEAIDADGNLFPSGNIAWAKKLASEPDEEQYWILIRDEAGQPFTENTYTEKAPVEGVTDIRATIVNTDNAVCERYVLINNATILPVRMLSFTAEKRGEHVQVKWVTSMERNNTGFEVQVSEDGTNFRKLAWVTTLNGNTNSLQAYEYTDTEKGKVGLRYYQLKQIDVDNTSEIFGPVSVNFGNSSAISISPNPFQNELKLKIESEAKSQAFIVMTNAVGVHILQHTMKVNKGHNELPVILQGNLPSGVYFITVRMGDTLKQFKLLKQ